MTIVSFINMQPEFMQHHAPRFVLIHKGDIVSGNDDRGSGLVQLDKKFNRPRVRDRRFRSARPPGAIGAAR